MTKLTLKPVTHVSGEIHLPGSKSLSNRALLLAALAKGKTKILNLLEADDVSHMVHALKTLGVQISWNKTSRECLVEGLGGAFPATNESLNLNLGNAGTAIRPLTAALSLSPGTYVIDGDKQMRERPIAHLVDALKKLGADLTYLTQEGYPPVKVKGGKLAGGTVSIAGDLSSQYLTSLLLVLPLCRKESILEVTGEQVSKPYLHLTLCIMKSFGVVAHHENFQKFVVPGNQNYESPGSYLVEGDASSASYFLAAAAIKGGTVRVHGIGNQSVQGDVQFLDVLEKMGASVCRSNDWVEVSGHQLTGIDMDLNHIPDAAMTIATTALFAKGQTIIRNIYNWRIKETDRMSAMATELRKLGAEVETGEDYMVINPPEQLQSCAIETYNDHRIAMAFSLAALGDQEITILDPECTAKTFPDYFDLFESVCR